MTKFKIARDETWRLVYEIEAKEEKEAIEKIENEEAELVNEGEMLGDTKYKVLSAQPTVVQATLG